MLAGRSVVQASPGWVRRPRGRLGPVGSPAPGQGQGCGRPHGEALVSGTSAQESKRQRSPDAPKPLCRNEPTALPPAARALGGFSSGRGSRLRHRDPRVPAPRLQPKLGLPGASRGKPSGASAGSPGTWPGLPPTLNASTWPCFGGGANAPAHVTGRACELRPAPVAWVLRPPPSPEDPRPRLGATWGPRAPRGLEAGGRPPPQVPRARPLQRSLLMVAGPRTEGGQCGQRGLPASASAGWPCPQQLLVVQRPWRGGTVPSRCAGGAVFSVQPDKTSGTWRERVGVPLGSHPRHFAWVPTQGQARSPATWPPARRTWGRRCSPL